MSSIVKEAEVAARWWANKLRDRVTVEDAGLRPEAMKVFADLKEQMPPIAPESADRFEAALQQLIQSEFVETESWKQGEFSSFLRVDYWPDRMLSSALQTAGIQPSQSGLPAKTIMWVEPGSVSVKAGYSAQRMNVYST